MVIKNVEKLEFVLTDACTGNCRHCSQGYHKPAGTFLRGEVGARCVKSLAETYGIKTVLVFGGEPLLYPDEVYKIISAARDCAVLKRQVITNGFFTKDVSKMQDVATALYECGVNDLLLSADAFHQETIPLETVMQFARELKRAGVPTRIQPAWLVSKNDGNPYNQKTREIVSALCDIGFCESEGNVIFCEGNAKKYLLEYFDKNMPPNPYAEDPNDIRCISVDADGTTLCGNINTDGIKNIIKRCNLLSV